MSSEDRRRCPGTPGEAHVVLPGQNSSALLHVSAEAEDRHTVLVRLPSASPVSVKDQGQCSQEAMLSLV